MSAQRRRFAVLASGRGSNFKSIAQRCEADDAPAEVVCLITDNPDAGAIAIARQHGIPVVVIDAGTRRGRLRDGAEEEIVAALASHNVEFVFLAGFMRILRGPLLEAYPNRILNVHPSLLPAFKGLNAQAQALAYGVKVAGCTVHLVDASVDGGPIVLQEAVPVEDGDTEESLSARILEAEHRIAARAVDLLATGKVPAAGHPINQNEGA